jgi:catechol 2,3-dioxygenase-like lactoylglutathione lyase family enzyme
VFDQLVPIFRVDDAREALSWYRRLGFEWTGEHQFEPGFPLYVFLQRGDVQLHLSEHSGDAPPCGVAYLFVDAVEPIAAEFGVAVTSQPWGREIELTDPFGNRLRIGTPTNR